MASHTQGASSPSASSIFLPLGRRSRRGSRTSISTQTEREHLNEALDQIHTAACHSDELTVFNEFTNPPVASSNTDNKGIVGDLQGGLTGLYSRFRASVGGVKDIVGASTKSDDATPTDGSGHKSPSTSVFASNASSQTPTTVSNDAQSFFSNSAHTSKAQSPVLASFPASQEELAGSSAIRSSRLSSKAGSVSSKTSGPAGSALKSPIAPLTKSSSSAADPTLTEVNVNAVREGLQDNRSHSGSISSSVHHQYPESAGSERKDSMLHAAVTSNGHSQDLGSSRQSQSGRPSVDFHRDTRAINDAGRLQISTDTASYDRLKSPPPDSSVDRVTESDMPFSGPTWRNAQIDEIQDSRAVRRESQQGNSTQSLHGGNSPTPSSAANSTSRLSVANSSTHDSRTPATLNTSISMTDKEPSSMHSSKASLQKQRPNMTPRVSQSRLPGFSPSRKPSAETTDQLPAPDPRTAPATKDSSHTEAGRGQRSVQLRDNTPNLKNKLLGREFWMRDENAKDCFHCGEPFSTFRRKHHCRTCGQIFDSKCTSLMSGADFGYSGSVRVCLPCEAMINAYEDDSSDFSGDDMSPVIINTKTPETPGNGNIPRTPKDDDDTSSIFSQSVDHVLKTPTMAIPATRRPGDGNDRRSAILEIDSDRQLTRPTSSRSLKSSSGRSHSLGHKRHHSRNQYIRSFKPYHEDRAPFQRRIAEDMKGESRLPAFHRDSIIDPDLAQYLSDDASSEDEQSNIFSMVSEPKSSGDTEKMPFGGLLAAMKKGRSRLGDRSGATGAHASRDGEDGSVASSRAVNLPRSTRRRNLSIASSIHQRLSPKALKETPSAQYSHDSPVVPFSVPDTLNSSGFKMTRSSSMRGAGAPAIELNRASLEHVRVLLRQLLKDTDVPHAYSWETALVPILLKATDDVDPAVQHGDDMDIRHYVKLKKIPGGRPGDTSYVSGLVFTKNLALKSMPRNILRPNILIITFPLEYARQQQHFMSLEPVIRQEREFLENLVGRIAALHPNLLLVEKNVSGLALEFLEKAKIATAYNVKPSVIEAVSRCTQTRIITSMDRLATTPTFPGHCGSFDLKTYVYNARKKTYMYISGCAKELGCTIVLRGADTSMLRKIKQITEFMVYVVYNLKLETCLMRDEFAKIPTLSSEASPTLLKSPAHALQSNDNNHDTPEQTTDAITNRASQDGNTSYAGDSLIDSSCSTISKELNNQLQIRDDFPMPAFYEDMVQKHQTKHLSASPFVKFMPPYLLMRARELERHLAYLKRLRDQDFSTDQLADEKNKTQKFVLITPEMIHESLSGASIKVKEVLHAVHDAEYDKALYNYETQKRQWEAYISGNNNLFDPYGHQNIVVLYSLVCTTTSVPCSGPDIFALGFYNEHESDPLFEADCTLGQYVEDLCHNANTICTVNGCEERMCDHHRQYVHGEAQVSVFVQPYPSKLRGLQDTILMWSCCKVCGNETPAIPMSDSTWKYSFGKYLELSFWSADLHARAGVCPHDLHRDHLRYFGFQDMALRIHYDPISLLEIIVPRPRITWKVEKDLILRNEVYNRAEQRLNKFMASVKARLKSISVESVIPEMADICKQEIEKLTKRANDEHLALIKNHQERYVNSRYWEVIPLNGVIRATQEKAVDWDVTFAEFERNFFPSEKDIRRLATLQLKKIFLDKNVSATSLTSSDEASTTPTDTGETTPTDSSKMTRRMTLSPQEAKNVLNSVVEEHSGKINKDQEEQEEEQDSEQKEPLPSSSSPTIKDSDDPAVNKEAVTTSEENGRPDPEIPSKNTANDSPNLSDTPNQAIENDTNVDRHNGTDPVEVAMHERSQTQVADQSQSSLEAEANTDDKVENTSSIPLTPRPSGIPRPSDQASRKEPKSKSPPLLRTYSQPVHTEKDQPHSNKPVGAQRVRFEPADSKQDEYCSDPSSTPKPKGFEKRISERLGLPSLKASKLASSHSLIPRSVQNKRSSRVSNLAKHFEQLSREFEKERQRERRLRAAHGKQSRAYPMATSNPIVEVYNSVRDAVEEREPLDEDSPTDKAAKAAPKDLDVLPEEAAENPSQSPAEETPGEPPEQDYEQQDEPRTSEESIPAESRPPSETGGDDEHSDIEKSLLEELQITDSVEDGTKVSPEGIPLDLKELPKDERSSLVKMLTNFWAERSASGWAPLEYPLSDSDHVFMDCDIIVREDEPSSLVAFALDSEDYKLKLRSIQKHEQSMESNVSDAGESQDHQPEVEQSLLRATGTHLKYQFQEGQAKMLCKVFYAEQFDALRRKCGVSDRIVESLSRCMKFDSKGGKTKSLFLKTLDERFILKSLSTTETQAFLKFAPAYFQIMSEALFHELPSAIAKMFGFYQVIIKNPVTGVDFNWFLLLMENLFYDRTPTRIFDLKGSMRNRKVQSTGERNEVLLDENMVEFIYESPLFTREHSKKLLSQSVWNDTLFLARQNVMDYSLVIAIDESRQELVVGIIDCIRTYTWDKKLESWIKDRGFAGGGKNRPTVTSPKEYKSRFREAMARYVLHAPK